MTVPARERRLSVGIVADMLEEGWTSMDLVADMLFSELQERHSDRVDAVLIRPPMPRRFSADGARSGASFAADRLLSRFHDYPRVARGLRGSCDVFHVVDHSYAQLVHALPRERTIVTCHDLDAFRSILEPDRAPRSLAFRLMIRRVLSGFRKAAHVVCDTSAIREELLFHRLFPPERVSVVPVGVHPSCSPEPHPEADADAARILPAQGAESVDLLHVGSTIPRKRIDLLLRIFAEARRARPHLRLIRVGGPLTDPQRVLARELGIENAIVELPFISRPVLAAVYRRAALVLLPSEAEGFGLPVAEAMACGTVVLASDLDVLREVGGSAGSYAPVGDIGSWVRSLDLLLRERDEDPERWELRRLRGMEQASGFSWRDYAARMTTVYEALPAIARA